MPPCQETSTSNGIATSLSSLPSEIITMIMEQLHPFSDPPERCTYLVSPSFWFQALKEHIVLPWLWDLDTAALDEKENNKPVGQMWDWELLVRQLAQRDLYHIDREETVWAVEGFPEGLRNRNRIWHLVVDMLDESSTV